MALSVRTWCGANGVALVEAETEEEEEEGAVGDVGSAVYPEDWKYLWVGTVSAAAPSAPLVSDEWRVRWLDTCEHEQKGSWCVGIGGELRLGIGLIEEDHIGVGMSCVRAMSVEHVLSQTGENTHCLDSLLHTAPNIYSKHVLRTSVLLI